MSGFVVSCKAMEVIADLHLHSRYSIATGRDADLEHLDLWGRYKGVRVVGTGDCTHPEWLKEMAGKLVPVAEGTYALKRELALPSNLKGSFWQETPRVRFLITGEVSAIYKKGGRVRKVHLLLLLSSLEHAEKLSQRLGRLGNVSSDGRPILGLDARHLLELTLETDPRALVIPAHIWTPWFSVLGSKSGFDSLEECFEDGVNHIYALETGLSSDPAMNWRVSALDRFRLVSNSDAHSPAKLGREANLFNVPPDYASLARALRSGEGFRGTIEFFPQEGKYHLDGHRNCGLRLTPEEAEALGGICPQCGKALTYGVMHRVLDLADRTPGSRPAAARPYESLIALLEILKEVLEVSSANSKKVQGRYFRLLEKLGPELNILRQAPLEDLAREGGERGALLARGIEKMRRGEVHIAGGYDGAYGEIRLFTPEERLGLLRQSAFFSPPAPPAAAAKAQPAATSPAAGPLFDNSVHEKRKTKNEKRPLDDPLLAGLNPAQRQAVTHQGPPLLVAAGPGTGKTKALTHRLAYLLARRGVAPNSVLAVTFTRQAAAEMKERIQRLLPDFPGKESLAVKTFHALGLELLRDHAGDSREVATEEQRRALLREVARDPGLPAASLDRQIITWKQALLYPEDLETEAEPYKGAYQSYEAALAGRGWWDYEDLIARTTLLLSRQPELLQTCRARFRHLLVDEYQDLNQAQYRLFRALAGPGAEIMAIGDPDQAIYGFRGANPHYFARFVTDWPDAVSLTFSETYRLPRPVLEASRRLRAAEFAGPLGTHQRGADPLVLLEAATEEGEARAIAREIQQLMGGLTHYALEDDSLRHDHPQDAASFRDVAVLYRLHALGPGLERSLTEAGIPCQQAREGVGPEWEGLDLAAEKVKLLSLHAAKGLEFPYVFIAGCEAGLIPWEPEDCQTDPEEERRLFYVGLTRASRRVYLSRSRERTLWGQRRRTRLSPLVEGLPPETLQRPQSDSPRRPSGRQRHLFPELRHPGDRKGR
jgi:DNA helicase-2/ATP-dependent DNA helicase PcrA